MSNRSNLYFVSTEVKSTRESRSFSFEFFIPPVALRQIVLSRARKARNETRLAKRKNTFRMSVQHTVYDTLLLLLGIQQKLRTE